MAEHATYEFDVEDIEYLRHGDKPLLARVYKPRGQGPFPGVIELHGGAWVNGDRKSDTYIGETFARAGIVVAAVDFRMPPDAMYPGSIADIHYAIRWLKTHAREFNVDPRRVGLFGVSSGGHQALLVGMKPDDPRYAAIPNPPGAPAVDGSVSFITLFCPVISPLGRYRFAKRLKAGGQPYPAFVDNVLPAHDRYWGTEEAMADGDPLIAMQRGDKVVRPPVMYIQSGIDHGHPIEDRQNFIAGYNEKNGNLHIEVFDGEGDRFLRDYPKTEPSRRAMEMLIGFIHAQGR
jgi:acetyl esterase